jgi:hypothetical protein
MSGAIFRHPSSRRVLLFSDARSIAVPFEPHSRKPTLHCKQVARALTHAHDRTTADNAEMPHISSGQCLPLE